MAAATLLDEPLDSFAAVSLACAFTVSFVLALAVFALAAVLACLACAERCRFASRSSLSRSKRSFLALKRSLDFSALLIFLVLGCGSSLPKRLLFMRLTRRSRWFSVFSCLFIIESRFDRRFY